MSDRVKAMLADIMEMSTDEKSELTEGLRRTAIIGEWDSATESISTHFKSMGIDENAIDRAFDDDREAKAK